MHSKNTLSYFCAPPGHFWEWRESGRNQEIGWSGQEKTLMLREELQVILNALAPHGLPRLGALLIASAALAQEVCLETIGRVIKDAASNAAEDSKSDLVNGAWSAVESEISRLRRNLLKPRLVQPPRFEWLRIIFSEAPRRLSAAASATILTEFQRTPYIFDFQLPSPTLDGRGNILRDLTFLKNALERLPDDLENLLKTGLADDFLRQESGAQPVLELPEESEVPRDLLAAMEKEGGELGQIAGLVRQVTAFLHFPKAMERGDELPVGGVSDITNRGDPSRLLMTELAWDDMTFAARLSQGESLYTRREAPPADPPGERIVLLDTGIFMWGKPRLFALAAALSALRQPSSGSFKKTRFFSLSDGAFQETELNSLQNVRDQLERQEPSPDFQEPLAALFRSLLLDATGRSEWLVISHATSLEALTASPVWQRIMEETRLHSLQADRHGTLELRSHSRQGTRVHSRIQLKLESLLTGGAKAAATLTREEARLPHFYRTLPWPLNHPAPPRAGYLLQDGSLVGLSVSGCIGHWKRGNHAGRVIRPGIPAYPLIAISRDVDDPALLYFLFRREDKSGVEMLALWLDQREPESWMQIPAIFRDIEGFRRQSGALVVHLCGTPQTYRPSENGTPVLVPAGPAKSLAFRLSDGALLKTIQRTEIGAKEPLWFDGEQFHSGGTQDSSKLKYLKQADFNPERDFRRLAEISKVGFNEDDELLIQKQQGRIYRLHMTDTSLSWVLSNDPGRDSGFLHPLTALHLPDWPNHGLSHVELRDGRRIVYDERGFLHVIDPTSGGTGRELSVALVKGETAVWLHAPESWFGTVDLFWDQKPSRMRVLMQIAEPMFSEELPFYPGKRMK